MNPKSLLFILALIISFSLDSNAQQQQSSRSKKKVKDDLLTNLWYGGGFNLGFNRSSIGNLSGNTFLIGISPMVGYRLFGNFSVGPRIELQYTTGRFSQFGSDDVFKYNAFTYGAGLFNRFKFLPFLFTHIEYDYLSREGPIDIIGNRITTDRQGESLFLLGGGYTSGGAVATEIYILYDVLADDNTTQLPLQYRFGFTYNF